LPMNGLAKDKMPQTRKAKGAQSGEKKTMEGRVRLLGIPRGADQVKAKRFRKLGRITIGDHSSIVLSRNNTEG